MELLDMEIERLKKEKPVYKDVLCFYQNLLRLFKAVKEKIKPSFHISEENLKKRLDNGLPVFQWDMTSYSEDDLKKCLRIVMELLPENRADKSGGILSSIENGKLKINEMLKEFTSKNLKYFEEMTQFDKETVKLLEIFSYILLKPVMEEELLHFQKKLENIKWNEAFCPFCGFLPSLAVIAGEEGHKFLDCSLCGHMWGFPRLLCISCKKEVKEYFYNPDDESCKVELCGECKNYTKVFDERNSAPLYPSLVKDLITLHMDVIAKEKGFSKESRSLFF